MLLHLVIKFVPAAPAHVIVIKFTSLIIPKPACSPYLNVFVFSRMPYMAADFDANPYLDPCPSSWHKIWHRMEMEMVKLSGAWQEVRAADGLFEACIEPKWQRIREHKY